MDINTLCPLCNNAPETISHILLSCSFSEECWNRIEGSNAKNNQDFLDWLTNSFDRWENDRRQRSAMLCWSIWNCRNDLVWNQKGKEVTDVVESARVALNHWKCAQDRTFDNFLGYMTQADGDEQWRRPMENKIKINADAAIFGPSNCFSFSYVARDHSGEVLAARSMCKLGNISPESAEAMGVREALSWLKDQQHNNVIVETDCLVLVQALRSSGDLLSYFCRLVEECKVLMSELRERNVFVKFVKRSANMIAHFLAKSTCSVADRDWQVCDAHPDFIDVLMNDLIS